MFGSESEMFVWLINHIPRRAASYDGTGVSEGDQSLGSPEIFAVPQDRWKEKSGGESPGQEALPTMQHSHLLLSWERPLEGLSSTAVRTRVANEEGTADSGKETELWARFGWARAQARGKTCPQCDQSFSPGSGQAGQQPLQRDPTSPLPSFTQRRQCRPICRCTVSSSHVQKGREHLINPTCYRRAEQSSCKMPWQQEMHSYRK